MPEARGPRAVLYVLPHPDDEIFAAGLFDHFARLSFRQHLVWLSYGGLFPRWRDRETRRAERCLAAMGVSVARERLPDGALWTRFPDLVETIGRHVDVVGPEILVTTAFEGGNADHDAACLACTRFATGAGGTPRRLYVVPAYRLEGRRLVVARPRSGNAAAEASPIRAEGGGILRRRLELARVYASQWLILAPLLVAAGRRFFREQELVSVSPGEATGPAASESRPLYAIYGPLQRALGFTDAIPTPAGIRARFLEALPAREAGA